MESPTITFDLQPGFIMSGGLIYDKLTNLGEIKEQHGHKLTAVASVTVLLPANC